ncbi:hypothetical protein ILUMI_00199 [Ignelater luminosus]|uniref:RAP domain-containing protein n=1 Tax=Ignelater luminosus TaxID=2038154 RepID=A0A8K0GQG4_IGNLU|nr:hypothetical protein ILUMI_00199 [Ignelater luminosus]
MNFVYKTSRIIERLYVPHHQVRFFLSKVKIKQILVEPFNYKNVTNQSILQNSNFVSNHCRFFHNDTSIENDIDEIDNTDELLLYDDMITQHQPVRNILYPDSKDPYIVKLNECVSIQEVLNFINENSSEMQHQHIIQAILVLWDLQKMFINAHQINNSFNAVTIKDHLLQLTDHSEFHKLLELVQERYKELDVELLSCALLYLNKIGIDTQHEVLQLLISQLRKALKTDISLSALSRFIVTVSNDHNLAIYFLLQDSIPFIVEALGKCESAENLKLITICLNHLHYIVGTNLLQQYQDKVIELMEKDVLTSKHSRVILKILTFLSHSRWSDKNTILMSKLMMLLKNNLHTLNVYDFFIVYEIMYKNHEPGDLLTEMQRCASRLLLLLDEDQNLASEIKLKLLSSLVCFSSPKQRPEYEKTLSTYIKDSHSLTSLFDLLRILTFVKPDSKLCDEFWDNVLETVDSQKIYRDSDNLLKLSQRYINFSNDLNYRHKRFEESMLNWLKKEMDSGTFTLIPSKCAIASTFIFSCESDKFVIDSIMKRITDNWEQLNHADCLHISKGLRNIETMRKSLMSGNQFNLINVALDRAINEKLISMGESTKVNFLLKSCIYRRKCNKELINKLLMHFKPEHRLSSNSIRNIIFSLQSTNGLLPDILDNIADYVISYKDNLLGFNAEKVAYLCYYLGYLPNNSDQLFQVITDIILRDQERISGLSYIQAALSLCFFYKLPESFIKNIFNVTFLEKLDAELATCYFKDVYPIRVRNNMMQLNRAVCLDYPQSNVPWFHQKYIQQSQSKAPKWERISEIHAKFKSYILKVIEDPTYLTENATTAYGYHIDLLLNLDSNGQLLKPNEDNENGNRVAILLLKPSAYTRINVQLKGKYQLKKRHLEILGYRVLPINVSEWDSLIYGEQKVEYINKLIWPDDDGIASRSYSYIER